MTETFGDLIANAAHWEFEIFLMLLFDGLIAGLLYPFVRKHYDHHIARDERERLPKGRDPRMRGAVDLQNAQNAQNAQAYCDFAKEMKHQMPEVFGTPYVTPDPWTAIPDGRTVLFTPAPPLNGRPYRRCVTPEYAAMAAARRRCKVTYEGNCTKYDYSQDAVKTPEPLVPGFVVKGTPEPLWPASWYVHGMAAEAIKQKAAQAEVRRELVGRPCSRCATARGRLCKYHRLITRKPEKKLSTTQ